MISGLRSASAWNPVVVKIPAPIMLATTMAQAEEALIERASPRSAGAAACACAKRGESICNSEHLPAHANDQQSTYGTAVGGVRRGARRGGRLAANTPTRRRPSTRSAAGPGGRAAAQAR